MEKPYTDFYEKIAYSLYFIHSPVYGPHLDWVPLKMQAYQWEEDRWNGLLKENEDPKNHDPPDYPISWFNLLNI